MNTKTTLILSVAVLLACLAIWWAQPSEAPQPVDAGKPVALFDPKPADVTKFELVAWGRPAMVFEKTGDDDWTMLEPIKAPADKSRVRAEIDRITGLQAVKSYKPGDEGRPAENLTKFQEPAWIAKLTDKAGNTHTVRVGQPVPLSRQTYVQKDGDESIHLVKADLNTDIKSDVTHYRDTRVAEFVTGDAKRISVQGGRPVTLAKNDGQWTIESPVRARADSSEVNRLLTSVSNARASKFVESKAASLAIYGLDKPRLSITVETEKRTVKPATQPAGTQPAEPEWEIKQGAVTLVFGAVADGKVFAKLAGDDPWVFQLPDTVLTQSTPDLNKLRDKKVVAADTNRATKITVNGPDGAVELQKKDGAWRIASAGGAAGDDTAEFAAVDDLLKAVRDLKASEYEDETGFSRDYGFGSGATTVEIVAEGSLEPVRLVVGRPTPAGTGVFVRNEREGSVAVVKADSAALLKVSPMSFVNRKLLQLARDRAERIEVSRPAIPGPGATTTVVAKEAMVWTMLEPVRATVETKSVTDLLSDLSSLDARTIVGTQADLAKFGLDTPAATAKITVAAPPKPRPATQPATQDSASAPATEPAETPEPPTVHVVRATQKDGKAYVFVEGSTKIGEVDDKVYRNLIAEMHESRVTQLDTSKLAGVELKYPDRTLNLQKTGDDWTLEGEPGFRGDATKIRAVADALRDLKTDRFVEYATTDLASFKLDSPAISVTVRLEDGRSTQLLVSSDGPTGDEAKRRYASIGGTGKVFLIAPAEVTKFEKQIKDIQKAG